MVDIVRLEPNRAETIEATAKRIAAEYWSVYCAFRDAGFEPSTAEKLMFVVVNITSEVPLDDA